MSEVRFDLPTLFRSVDAERERRGLSWAALARQIGVSASTIRRFASAEDAEADGVLASIRWLGVAPETFVEGIPSDGVRLPANGDGFVRVDMELIAQATGSDARGRTRTTIQRLVVVAYDSKQPLAELTRLREF